MISIEIDEIVVQELVEEHLAEVEKLTENNKAVEQVSTELALPAPE